MLRGINTRRYADLLFRLGEEDEGREQYRQSIQMFGIEQDQSRRERGYTYVKWARNEAQNSRMDYAEQHLREAEEIYNTIKNERMKKTALDALKKESKVILQLVNTNFDYRTENMD